MYRVSLFPTIASRRVSRAASTAAWVTGPFNWVNGRRCEPVDSFGAFNNIEPRTGQLLCQIPSSGQREVDRAVAAARAAFGPWSELSGMERGRLLLRAGELLRGRGEELAMLDVRDNGKPVWEARADMNTVSDCFAYYGGLAPAIVGQHVKLPGGSWGLATREPIGVVGGIGAWNYPLQSCSWKVGPALACGNTFVYKPSQLTPLAAVVLGEVLQEAGVPDGVFNVIQGEGATGAELAQHPGCDKLTFTGSVETGTRIMEAGARGIKHVTLELGGKSPLIIFDDANLENAVKGALMANFLSQGEVCSNGTRIFVQKGIYSRFLQEFVKQAKKMRVGDPMDEKTTVGATISGAHAAKVLNFVHSAVEAGAILQCGGRRVLLEGACRGGWFLPPTVLTNCTDQMRVAREEVFGAVAVVFQFETEDEVIHRANDSEFGLAGGVFTADLQRAHRVVHKLQAGTIWINTFNLTPPELPFGGFKKSGIGRENGLAAVDHYTQYKTVYVEMNDVDCGPLYSPD